MITSRKATTDDARRIQEMMCSGGGRPLTYLQVTPPEVRREWPSI
jgi:hypothetical protein